MSGRADRRTESTRAETRPEETARPARDAPDEGALSPPIHAVIARGGVSNAAVAAHLARFSDPVASVAMHPGDLAWDGGDAGSGAERITGPESPGDVQTAGELVVEQIDEHTTEILYGDSSVRFQGGPGERYVFSISPPIAKPPPRPDLLISPIVGVPELEPLPQRAIRLTGTLGVRASVQNDSTERVAPLVLHETHVQRLDQVSDEPWASADVWELGGPAHAEIRLDSSLLTIDAREAAGEPAVPRFAYWIDPEWTGERGAEKHVTVAAAPGVTVDMPETLPLVVTLDYGRRLVADVVRVPHPALVPAQGTRFTADELVGYETFAPGAAGPWALREQDEERIVATTGLAGVTIEHPASGAQLSLRPKDRTVGAAYAWQVLPAADYDMGQIRAVVGPGVEVELREPLPPRLRSGDIGPDPEPLPGSALPGEGIEAEGVRVEIVEVDDAADVPVQGTPLNISHYERLGRLRTPDRHAWLDTSELMTGLATTAVDVGVGSIPIIGDLVDIGEFFHALGTDHDRWGREVSTSDKVLMGIGAVIGLIPFVGGVGAALRAGTKVAVQIADAARRWGKSPEQLELVLMAVRKSVGAEDAPLVRRALSGAELDADDLARLQGLLTSVGASAPLLRFGGAATPLALDPLAELAVSGRRALASDEYLDMLADAARSRGEVPPQLLAPLAADGAFASADEAQAALQQALRDRARDADAGFDAAFAEHIADDAAGVLREIVEKKPQTRRVAVSEPEALAEYERLANSKLSEIVQDVLAKQKVTPARARLEVLREEFAVLRKQVGTGAELTAEQRARAMEILAEARKHARADFNNVRNAVNRRLRKDKELRQLEQQLRDAGDVTGSKTGGLRVRTVDDDDVVTFEPLNIEHRTRLSDNPWGYNHYENLLVTDAAQNQQFLETLRAQGGIWPTDQTELFVITHGLHDQTGVDFRPGKR